MNNLKNYWFIVAESHELKKNKIIARTICNENIVAFRGTDNKVCIMQDRCIHRCAKLSKGKVKNGCLTCPYHGWVYNNLGEVINIPAHIGIDKQYPKSRAYLSCEQQGYIYVCLNTNYIIPIDQPFTMPEYNNPNFKRVRLTNYFHNNLANCVENFIDVPHTAYIHKGIFRKVKNKKINATITRNLNHVEIDYKNEKDNLGSFSKFLNPKNQEVLHIDNYYGPNITHVIYKLQNKWTYTITSQSIPVTPTETKVYTEICYNFGLLNYIPGFKLIIKHQAQKVIDQDIVILNQQMEVIKKYGENFWHTSADLIHCNITDILNKILRGDTPSNNNLNNTIYKKNIEFWV